MDPDGKSPHHQDILKMPDLTGVSPTKACDTFLKSEEFYVERALRIISELYWKRLQHMNNLNRGVLTPAEMELIFLNINNIYEFNNQLKSELWETRLRDGGVKELLANLGQIMVKFIPFFKLYTSYIKNYRNALKMLEDLKRKKTKLAKFLELNELCAGHPLPDLLLTPVARLPQYLTFLGAIYQGMDKNSPASGELAQAIRAIQGVTDEITFSLRDQVARKLVVTVQQKVFGGKVNLISPHRYVVKHGNLRAVFPKSMFGGRFKTYLFVLFNDCLLYGTRGGRLMSGTPKRVFRLKGMMVSDAPDEADYRYAFRVQSDSKLKEQYNLLLHCQSQKEKDRWVHDLQEEIKTFAQKEETLSIGEISNSDFEDIVLRKRSDSGTPSLAPLSIPTSSGGPSSTTPRSASISGISTASTPTSASLSQYSKSSYTSYTPTSVSSTTPSPSTNLELWEKKFDTQYNAYYWENRETKESSWDMPEGWKEPTPKASGRLSQTSIGTSQASKTTRLSLTSASTPLPQLPQPSPKGLAAAAVPPPPVTRDKSGSSAAAPRPPAPAAPAAPAAPLPPGGPRSSRGPTPPSGPSPPPPPPALPSPPALSAPPPPRGGPGTLARSLPSTPEVPEEIPPPPPDTPERATPKSQRSSTPPTPSDIPAAPPLDVPCAPPMDASPSPKTAATAAPTKRGSASAAAPADLFSSIRNADKGMLKKAGPPRKASVETPPDSGDLNAALKQSLDRYRVFVQDDEDDIDAGGGGDGDDWDP